MTLARGVVRLVVALTGLLVIAACSIQPNSSPRDIPDDQQSPLDVSGASPGPAIGTGRIFLVRDLPDSDDPQLVSVQRPAVAPESVINALFEGPNEAEVSDGLTTAIPPEVDVASIRQATGGTLIIDVTEEILDLASSELRLAIGQIIYTAVELPMVRSVQLLVDDEARQWPNARGELQSDPLTVYDFPALAESIQPPYPPTAAA